MKLTDLNINCLEVILDHLEFYDLLNAADTGKRLQHVVRNIFAQRYGQNIWFELQFLDLVIEQEEKVAGSFEESFSYNVAEGDYSLSFLNDEKFKIVGRKAIFQAYRCFGPLCYGLKVEPKLRCSASMQSGNCDGNLCYVMPMAPKCAWCRSLFMFYEHIAIFFSNTLKRLHMDFEDPPCIKKVINFNYFKKPFARVENLSIATDDTHYLSNKNRTSLARLFPVLRKLHLDIQCSEFFHSGCLAVHFPQLETLHINNRSNDTDSDICSMFKTCSEMCVKIVRSNPQLKRLVLSSWDENMNVFQNLYEMLENLAHLEYLSIDLSHVLIRNFNGRIMHLKSLKYLRIESFQYEYPDIQIYPFQFIIPFASEQLESVTIPMTCEYALDEHFYSFCEENPTIKEVRFFHIEYEWGQRIQYLMNALLRLVNTLPLLEKFHFSPHTIHKGYVDCTFDIEHFASIMASNDASDNNAVYEFIENRVNTFYLELKQRK